jgi:hypothetical protein
VTGNTEIIFRQSAATFGLVYEVRILIIAWRTLQLRAVGSRRFFREDAHIDGLLKFILG